MSVRNIIPSDDTLLPAVRFDPADVQITIGEPPAPTPPPVIASVAEDIFRGGLLLTMNAAGLIFDTSRNEDFLSTSVPSAWTATGPTDPTIKGLILQTAEVAGTTETLTSSDVYDRFHALLDIEVIAPTIVHGQSVDVFTYRFTVGTDTLDLRVLFDSSGLATIIAEATVAGVTTVGGGVIYKKPFSFTLELVRSGARTWAFVQQSGSRTMLLDFRQFATGTTGAISFVISNGNTPAKARVRVKNFKVESHARIGDRLLDNKKVTFKRVIGNVPAATLAEVGFVDLEIFGLFGRAFTQNGFEYTLPTPRTVGRDQNRVVENYDDEQFRDGE